MAMIIDVMLELLTSFFYLFGLVFLFVYIFALAGMEIFGGKLDFESNSRQSFDDFYSAFNSAFQVLSSESWDKMLFEILRGNTVNTSIVFFYFISCVILGKYILFNLFVAMIIHGFSSKDIKQQIIEIEDDMIASSEKIDVDEI